MDALESCGMAKRSKTLTKPAIETRAAISAYLVMRIAMMYPELKKTDAYARIGKAAGGLSVSTMRRLVEGTVSPTADTLSNLADALGCTVPQLTGGVHGGLRRAPLRPDQRL